MSTRGLRTGVAIGRWIAGAALWLGSVSCGGADSVPPEPGRDESAALRVVSLSPAITSTMIDLGAGDLLVGRTPYCRGIDASVPAVGSLLEFDPEALLAVGPDLVLVQPGAAGIDPRLEELAARQGWRIRSWRIDGIGDLERLLQELPDALAEHVAAERIAGRAARRIADLEAVLSPLSGAASSVVVLFAMEPPMAFGQGTFVGDLLERSGIENAIAARGYPELAVEDLATLAPARIVLLRDGPSDAARRRLEELPVPTPSRSRRVVEHPDALTPGSGWIEAAALLRDAMVSDEPAP